MHLRLISETAAEFDPKPEDDLAGAAGVLNGLAICAAVYLLGFGVWYVI